MLRKFFDYQLKLTEEDRPLARFRPLVKALDTFFYEAPLRTMRSPHIRDLIDLKRWMMLVVYALVPCILMAIWNSGMQSFVYGSVDVKRLYIYMKASETFGGYFAFSAEHFWPILKGGLVAFLPVMLISYAVGGFWEVLFAIVRRHEVSEGFLVTGMLFALILPSTIPYWMVAVGVSAGVIIGKELFGGTGMNILNPALVCRAFIFFAFPTKVTGDVWVGTNPTKIQESIQGMNRQIGEIDGITQASMLNRFNISDDIKRIHVDAIGLQYGKEVKTKKILEEQLRRWKPGATFTALTPDEQKRFITAPLSQGGLGLSPENYTYAVRFSELQFAQGILTNTNFFFGNRIGSMGETSILSCLLGAFLLIYCRLGSWRTMLAVVIGAFLCASLFEWLSGPLSPAKYGLPAYKHFLLGSLVFGLVFMATDPVSSPAMKGGRWLYGLLIGVVTIIIRVINPAFPEGVMLAILFGNVFSPLIDHLITNRAIKKRYDRKKIIIQ
ncbi:NADH:ubiquinone reductase (Na(+)-transporting) subunit B [Candidatus Neptunochlamydia vexilliferae]|uniref:Na(+)-translocating NADH-quinone reductase subunit B n=1 Tax=Candidatus Neptunichlamydia vexilliferae TaxID=1651774 RepID=A0ABS0AYX0_9BACT|nr:NADH:ubiquinone reductase (Na(+)-transporting) subunit B [Candidatus Neptunochlamydia vexilliferae]MBF5059314.1 Na(+)-translocating NADH-quinone reductase subunit B [Candidatus Neptunochlamydia vexilliferae]